MLSEQQVKDALEVLRQFRTWNNEQQGDLLDDMPFTDQEMNLFIAAFMHKSTRQMPDNAPKELVEAINDLNHQDHGSLSFNAIKIQDIKFMMAACMVLGAWLEKRIHNA